MDLNFSYVQRHVANKAMLVVLLKGETPEHEKCYVYLSVNVSVLKKFYEALEAGNVDLGQYAKIIETGLGDPPQAVREKMQKAFLFGHERVNVCVLEKR